MKKSLSKNIISFILCSFFIFLNTFVFYCNGMNTNSNIQLSTSPQENGYWFNPINVYNTYNRHYEISNGCRKFWVIGIPIGTNEHNSEFTKEKFKTQKLKNNFEQKFVTDNFSYLEEDDKNLTDKIGNRLGHIAATITFLCSKNTDLSNEERLSYLEKIWQDYKDYIPPIFIQKLNKEVIAIANLLNQQVQQVQNRFEGLKEYELISENSTNDNSTTEE